MSWEVLDESTARAHGANTEEAIQYMCLECRKGNLDRSGKEICMVQARYILRGFDPAVRYDTDSLEVRCDREEPMDGVIR